mmetsp:Transcript_13086/g.35920  ORF Transcript_13086/g.35920 Transcript_13086/m.35920 type:complete len:381 (+) Transcript_13086:1278-2420(+)
MVHRPHRHVERGLERPGLGLQLAEDSDRSHSSVGQGLAKLLGHVDRLLRKLLRLVLVPQYEVDLGHQDQPLTLALPICARPEERCRLGGGGQRLVRLPRLHVQLCDLHDHPCLLVWIADLPQPLDLLLGREHCIVLRPHLHVDVHGNVQGTARRLPQLLVLRDGVLCHLQCHLELAPSHVHLGEDAQHGSLLRSLPELSEHGQCVLCRRQPLLEVLLHEVAPCHGLQGDSLTDLVPRLLEALPRLCGLPSRVLGAHAGLVGQGSHVGGDGLAHRVPRLPENLQGLLRSLQSLERAASGGADLGHEAQGQGLLLIGAHLAEGCHGLLCTRKGRLVVLPDAESIGGSERRHAKVLAGLPFDSINGNLQLPIRLGLRRIQGLQ